MNKNQTEPQFSLSLTFGIFLI
uniref:Uncharacterized protein n=1 Tax=Rhizophora mucronata TaxID=61149 RepID=A0A2P2NU70_RHIMU